MFIPLLNCIHIYLIINNYLPLSINIIWIRANVFDLKLHIMLSNIFEKNPNKYTIITVIKKNVTQLYGFNKIIIQYTNFSALIKKI